jgi:hypothetical protein
MQAAVPAAPPTEVMHACSSDMAPTQSLDVQAALAKAASAGQTAVSRELLAKGASVDAQDAQGLTPVMMAVLGGHMETAVQLALSGADLKRRDARGRTALELAILASNRETALALLLIATGKFTRPLAPLLPTATLLRLQQWVLDRTGKNGKAAAVVSAPARTHTYPCSSHDMYRPTPRALFPPLMLFARRGVRLPLTTCHSPLRVCACVCACVRASSSSQVAQQLVQWLTSPVDGGGQPSHEDAMLSLRGLISTLLWATRHSHTSLREQVGHYFATEAPKGAHLPKLVEAEGNDGHTVLHALVLAGQGASARGVLMALPREQAVALLRKRNRAGELATELTGAEVAPEQQAAVALAAQDVQRLGMQLAPAESAPPPAPPAGRGAGGGAGGVCGACGASQPPAMAGGIGAGGAASGTLSAAMGRGAGGAVRRRKNSDGGGGNDGGGGKAAWQPYRESGMDVEDDAASSDGQSKAAGAACELLQLAAAASSVGSAAASQALGASRSSRGSQSGGRQRDAKPYQRRGGGRGGKGGKDSERDKDCWLPGGFWWQDSRTPMPSGRQPGELAGWQPLAGHQTQQRIQEQQEALSVKESFVQGLGSRDDAAAYLQQLGRGQPAAGGSGGSAAVPDGAADPPALPRPLMRSVDDSEIDKVSEYKSLASWGGFRQHYIDQAKSGESPGAAGGSAPGATAPKDQEWKRRIQEQLLQKRAEIIATQRKLESLSLEQQELEKLYTSTNATTGGQQ